MAAHLAEQVEDANVELIRIPRWNLFRIIKALLRRDAAMQLVDFIDRIRREGKRAEEILAQRDPQAAKELQRPVFNHS